MEDAVLFFAVKNKELNIYSKNILNFFIFKNFKIKNFSFKNKWLQIKENIDEPSNIKWENIQYSSFLRFLRKCFSIFLSLIIVIASIAIVVVAKLGENEIKKNFNTEVDCRFIDKTEKDLLNEVTLLFQNKTTDNVVTYCFCYEKLTSNFTQLQNYNIKMNNSDYYPCKLWLELWIKSSSLKYGIIFLVPIINVVLSICLTSKKIKNNKIFF